MRLITPNNQTTADQMIDLVEKILEQREHKPKDSTQELESKIDSLVYALYGLSEEEITLIEGGN